MGNAAILVQVLFGLVDRAAEIKAVLQTAQSEGRDVSEAELDTLFAGDDAARAALDAAIKAARAA